MQLVGEQMVGEQTMGIESRIKNGIKSAARWVSVAAVSMVCLGAEGALAGPIVSFNTNVGTIQVQLFQDEAPETVENFLHYVTTGAYSNTFIHRVVNQSTFKIVQGGGYSVNGVPFPPAPAHIPTFAEIPLEYNLPNAAGTIAMARKTAPDSATSEFFFNVSDNTSNLGPSNNGGYTVFGKVLGNGLSLLSAISSVPRLNDFAPGYNGTATDPTNLLGPIPLLNFSLQQSTITASNLIIINSVTVPESSTIAPMVAGAAGLLVVVRRRRRQVA